AIGSRQFVTLKVYDILGNEIATLVNEEKSAGQYEVTFDSHSGEVRNLTSGIYFYQLKAGSFVKTKKMILLK
ncbi:MAG: T9SS type A sorting domain-containing protein, partial [Ignavibacteriaceae bacterium]|nr:T9SS type A sorting domain-containing protein [Ignavibacteriaceae bacterium]